MKKRPLVAVIATISALAMMAACSPTSDPNATDTSTASDTSTSAGGEKTSAAPAGEDVTLTVWSWRPEDTDKYKTIFAAYEAEHPGVTIDFETFLNTEYNQILTTGLTGSDGPDVAQVRAYGQLQGWVESGSLEPLDDAIPALQDLDPTILKAAEGISDGKHYSVPFATQTMHMYYNKDIFEANGLSEPTTWDEFIALNDKLLAAGVTPMSLGAKDAWVLPMFADTIGATRYGGLDFQNKVLTGETDFNDPNYVASLQLITDLQKYLPDNVAGVAYADSQLLFTSGGAAQFPGGAFELATFMSQNPDLNLGVYQVPPAPDAVIDHAVTPGWGDGGYAVNANSKKKDAAIELVKWMATKEFGQLFADNIKQFSPIPGVEYKDPLMQEMWDSFLESPASYLLLVNFRYGEPQGTAVLGEQVQKMFLGDTDAAGAAAALQTGISQWFTPSAS